MNKLIKNLVSLALGCGLLASCANVLGPRNMELPLHKMQAGVEKRFPLNRRILELVEVQLTNPRVTMLADTERIALSMDALVAPPFTRQSWRGQLALSGRLVIDAARNAVVLAEPRVDRFDIDGVDEGRRRQFTSAANVLMSQVAADMPLYHFRPEDLRYAGVQFVPARISATSRGLVVAIEPVR